MLKNILLKKVPSKMLLAKELKKLLRKGKGVLNWSGIELIKSHIFQIKLSTNSQLKNIDSFHLSNECNVKQCTVCLEAWPLKSTIRDQRTSEYRCLRCTRDKRYTQRSFQKKIIWFLLQYPYVARWVLLYQKTLQVNKTIDYMKQGLGFWGK